MAQHFTHDFVPNAQGELEAVAVPERAPQTHLIVRSESGYLYATGLTRDETLERYFPHDSSLPGEWLHDGSGDTPQTWAELWGACYDAHQMFEGWQTGDLLSFEGTVFARIESFEVIAVRSRNLPDKAAFESTRLPA